MYKIPHDMGIRRIDRAGWRAGVWPQSIYEYLPKEFRENDFQSPKISGTLFGDFLKNQRAIYGEKDNPYALREGYLATIIHEFGHVYYQQYKNWWYSDKKYNLNLLKEALKLYRKREKKKMGNLYIPSPYFFSEVFAFCAEYDASKLVFRNFGQVLDKFAEKGLKEGIKEEKEKNLESEDSVFNQNNPHILLAFTFGKLLMEKFPKKWPSKLLEKLKI